MALTTVSERAMWRLVERWELHGNPAYCLPVPIAQVVRNEGWTVRYLEGIYPLYGFAAVRGSRKLMGINAEVSRAYQRMAMAHEIGHVLNGDFASLHLCSEWECFHHERERAASEVAARLLIPASAIREYGSVGEIATACDVPLELVDLCIEAMRSV